MNIFEELFLRFLVHSNPDLIIKFCQERGRIKEIEEHITSNPNLAFEYARLVIKGRWEEAEPNISKNENIAITYAKDILKGRFPLFEKNILKNKSKIIEYCMAIKQRFPEAEPYLAKGSINDILCYAKNVIRGRFELAEPKIITRPHWILDYSMLFYPNKPPEEFHNAMSLLSFKDPNNKIIKEYFNKFGA